MWNWKHLAGEGWVAHTHRSVKLAALLLASGLAMLIHILGAAQTPSGMFCRNYNLSGDGKARIR